MGPFFTSFLKITTDCLLTLHFHYPYSFSVPQEDSMNNSETMFYLLCRLTATIFMNWSLLMFSRPGGRGGSIKNVSLTFLFQSARMGHSQLIDSRLHGTLFTIFEKTFLFCLLISCVPILSIFCFWIIIKAYNMRLMECD